MLKQLGVYGFVALFALGPVGCTAAGDADEDPDGIAEDDDDETDAGEGEGDDDSEGDDDAPDADDDACEGDECYFEPDSGADDDDTYTDGGVDDDGGTWSGDAGEADGGAWAGDGGDSQEAIDELDLPDYPGEDLVDETVPGVDENENGLRDDVERDLGLKYWPDQELIDVINELVKDDQDMITNPDDSDIISGSLERKKLALGCLELHFEGDLLKVLEVTGDIAAHMLNTSDRLAAARAVDAKLGGQVVTLPSDPEVERFCQGLWMPDLAVDPAEAAAENNAACRSNTKTVVTYSNSLLQRHDKAIVNGMALRQMVRTNGAANSNYIYKLAFNDSDSTYGTGGSTMEYGDFTALPDLIVSDKAWIYAFNRYQSGPASMPVWLKASLESSEGPVFVVDPADTQSQAASISSEATVGNRVFLVGQGAGALAVNATYASVVESLPDVAANVRVIGVGTPADSVAGDPNNTHYVTGAADLIVSETFAVGGTATGDAGAPTPAAALPANATNTAETEASGHEFLQSYVRGDACGPALQALLDAAITEVEAPDAIATDGAITVTLSWGEEPDVDLHAFEPSGHHVFYSSLSGDPLIGALDLDDTSSFGPEHYTVSCDTLVTGTYKIALNYFRGVAPESASVLVEAGGSQARTFTVELETAVGGTCDPFPILVADIVVSEGEEAGTFVFEVKDPEPLPDDPSRPAACVE
jgi:uncharacterized protein YfaP (DUF2135 family)